MVNSKGPKPASAERRLAELGIHLTPSPKPFGAYVESVQTGNLLYLSRVLPAIGHEPKFIGRLGREYNVEQGREAARIAALNALSAARNYLGSLDKVTRVVSLVAYLATEGTSSRSRRWLMLHRSSCAMSFGEDNLPVRIVLGVASLPLGMAKAWNQTRVSEILGIEYPIIQGPLGGPRACDLFTTRRHGAKE